MRKPVRLSGQDGKPFQITIDKFGKGVMTLFDDTRLPIDGVAQAQNMILDQDGVWVTRPPTTPYGASLTTPIDGGGSFYVYNADGTVTTYYWVIDNGAFKIAQDGGSWTTKTGVTWTTGIPVIGKQVSGLKSDGTRANILQLAQAGTAMAYYDIGNAVLGSYTALTTPGTVTPTKTGMSGGANTVYYRVTAVNAIGETLGSPECSQASVKQRDNWISGTDYIDLAWTAVPSATRYNIYYSDISGTEVFLDSTSTNAYRDTGIAVANPYQSLPDTDTTAGPKYGDLALSSNRMWATKDPNNPYRIGWTGTGQYMGAFNPFYGGGWIDLEKGGRERPEKVMHFRTGKGDAVATVLTADPTGMGSTWAISLTTLTVDTLVIVIPVASKQQGSVGTRSQLGAVEYNDSIYYPSPKGFHALGSQQSILNVLVTNEISEAIRPSVMGINNAYASKIAGYAYQGRVYWSVPVGSTVNNQIWVYDVERKGAWALPWTVAVKQFFEYVDSSGDIHLLGIPVSGTKLIEIGGSGSGDSGTAFTALVESGLIHWDRDHMTWAYIRKAYVELADPSGLINFQIYGIRRGKSFTGVASRTINSNLGESGFGADLWGDIEFGDSGSSGATFSQPSVIKVLNIKKVLNNIKWLLETSTVDARMAIIQLVIDGVLLPTSDPSEWKS